jgi:hypothetical protein
MNIVAAVLATASLPSSLNIRVILAVLCRNSGEHHTKSLKLYKSGRAIPLQRGLACAGNGAGRPVSWTRACPLGQRGGAQFSPYLPREQLAKLRGSAGVTAVTGCS